MVPKSSESSRDSCSSVHWDANQNSLDLYLFCLFSSSCRLMRTKQGVDSLSFDDLYNNLRVFENDVKGSTASSSSTQNVAFVSENTNNTNDVSTAYSVSNPSGQSSQYEQTLSYSLLAIIKLPSWIMRDFRTSLMNMNELRRNDLKWQGILIESVESKEIKIVVGNAGTCNKGMRETGKKEDSKALVTIDGEGVDWTSHSEEDEDYALMACNTKDRPEGGMHVVPPPMTGNYMPSGPDIEVDYSQFTYGPKQTQPSESETQTSEFDTCESNISIEPSELVSEPVVNESNVECQPKVWSDAPIIEEYESDSEDKETVKKHFTHSKNSKVDKKELGYGFTTRACFVCGSLNHLIRDCDFHEKRMAKQAELNNGLNRNSNQRQIRPIWNNVKRVNQQNQFVPTAVLTRTSKIPVNTARASGTKNVSTATHSFNRRAVLTNAAMKVNIVKLIVNRVRPANVFNKTHSPFSRPFNKITALRTKFSKQKVNTAKDYPHRALQNKGIVDSGCSMHMTGNKAYLAEYQDFNGGPIAFVGSKGYIIGKGKIKTRKLDFEDVCSVKELQHFKSHILWSQIVTEEQVKRSTTKDAGKAPNNHPDLKTDEKPVDKEDQVFLDELERLKRQEKDANDAAEALRKEFAQETENLLIQVGAAKASNPQSAVQTRSKVTKSSGAYAFVSYVQKQRRNNHKDFQHCLFACFLSQNEPKKISEALEDESWVDAMYLTVKPKLGLWYPKVSSFDLDAYLDSDYAGANFDRKSQQEVESISGRGTYYLAMPKCKTIVLLLLRGRICCLLHSCWAPRQKVCVIEKKLIQVFKIHTDDNVSDLLTKAFDVSKFQFLVIILNGNAEFHEIVDFLTRSSIHHALTVLERSSLPEKKFNTVQAHRFNTHYSRSKQDRAESLSAKRSTSVEQEHADERVGIPSSKEIGRKSAKGEPSVHKDPLIDEIPKDIVDYMETEDALDVGRTRDVVDEEKENAEDIHKKVSTDRQIVSTDGSKVSTDKEKDSTDRIDEAQVLLNMSQAKAVSREKEKGVEFKDIEETERPRPTSTRSLLTLKPLPKIDPKDKGK
ncbi:hypothetical protein Tco_0168358 [Tanacetum coccineum]